jgi:hypothetical protein
MKSIFCPMSLALDLGFANFQVLLQRRLTSKCTNDVAFRDMRATSSLDKKRDLDSTDHIRPFAFISHPAPLPIPEQHRMWHLP